jgi:two-component system, NarL family, sensor kinase
MDNTYFFTCAVIHFFIYWFMESESQVKFYFGIITSMLTLVAITVGFIIIVIRYQKRLLNKKKELLMQDVEHKKELLLTSINSAEAERQQIAKDIHDEIGSIFSTLSLSVNQIGENNPNNVLHLITSKKLLQAGIDSVRRISHAIVPFELELLGLEETLDNYFETLTSVSGLKINFENTVELKKLNHNATISIYRIIQELCSNCTKHAYAKNINIVIITNNENLVLNYIDDGKGTVLNTKKTGNGIGLKNIESRAILLNGLVEFFSEINKGFSCTITIPLKNNLTV